LQLQYNDLRGNFGLAERPVERQSKGRNRDFAFCRMSYVNVQCRGTDGEPTEKYETGMRSMAYCWLAVMWFPTSAKFAFLISGIIVTDSSKI
jgi:hypothetical protein